MMAVFYDDCRWEAVDWSNQSRWTAFIGLPDPRKKVKSAVKFDRKIHLKIKQELDFRISFLNILYTMTYGCKQTLLDRKIDDSDGPTWISK